MEPRYSAVILGEGVLITDLKNFRSINVPLSRLCCSLRVPYNGQQAQVIGENIEIDPPKSGRATTVPIQRVFKMYSKSARSRSPVDYACDGITGAVNHAADGLSGLVRFFTG